METFIDITSAEGGLKLTLCRPGTYYQGTRFDWSGVFRRITFNGTIYADEWFDNKTELSHDHVCGPSEEFAGSIGYDYVDAGGLFLKIGVGLLEKESGDPYDSFHLYNIIDRGLWNVQNTPRSVEFSQEIKGIYKYEKVVRITGEDSFEISHKLTNLSARPLSAQTYCHNFFNIDNRPVGPESSIELDFHPEGKWRENAVHGYVSGNSFRFDDIMPAGRNTYLGDITPPADGKGYKVTVCGLNGKKQVQIECDRPASKWVFWANSRVATPEPYVDLNIRPGEAFCWTTRYRMI